MTAARRLRRLREWLARPSRQATRLRPVGERDLTPNERAAVGRILEQGSFEGASELRVQLENAKVVGGIETFLHLEVAEDAPVSACGDGPVPVRALVVGLGGQLESEVLVWVRAGYLSAVEHAWYTDEAPTGLPPAERLRCESG